MATIVLTIPDAQLPRVISALCARPFILQTPPPFEPEVSGAAAKQTVIDWIKANVVAYEAEQARKSLPPPDVNSIVS